MVFIEDLISFVAIYLKIILTILISILTSLLFIFWNYYSMSSSKKFTYITTSGILILCLKLIQVDSTDYSLLISNIIKVLFEIIVKINSYLKNFIFKITIFHNTFVILRIAGS